jgi:parallel beta-helix repeat protein
MTVPTDGMRITQDTVFEPGVYVLPNGITVAASGITVNDGSYSPNIAFEATFSRGNIYRKNNASCCNYGFWLGFSRDTTLEENRMASNRQAGIAVENGFNFKVLFNELHSNGHGILLWSKQFSQVARLYPENDTSYNWWIEENTFSNNIKSIRIAADQDHGIRPLPASGELGLPAPHPHDHVIRRNRFHRLDLSASHEAGIELLDVENTTIEDNRFNDE